MNSRTMSRGLEVALLLTLLSTPLASSQMPPRPGKLVLTSTPPGAKIVINAQPRQEVTPITLVVTPGVYKVVVGSCAEQSVQIVAGDTKEVHCP
jgi:hypothetical protein